MRRRGTERKQEIWFRDAAVAERIDGVLFIGLKDWYPPIYDCGACGYATCAEFIEATKALRSSRSEEHTSELQSLMRTSYAVFRLKKKTIAHIIIHLCNTNYLDRF